MRRLSNQIVVLGWLALVCSCSAKSTTGGAPSTVTLTPSDNCSTRYAMDFGHTRVEVDPTQGARVAALQVDGAEILQWQQLVREVISPVPRGSCRILMK